MNHKVYFSLGSNLGDKEGNIREAISRIGELIGEVDRQSTLLATEPWGAPSNQWMDNTTTASSTLTSSYTMTFTSPLPNSLFHILS